MKILGMYRNGNYNVMLFEDGTKIRKSKAEKGMFHVKHSV